MAAAAAAAATSKRVAALATLCAQIGSQRLTHSTAQHCAGTGSACESERGAERPAARLVAARRRLTPFAVHSLYQFVSAVRPFSSQLLARTCCVLHSTATAAATAIVASTATTVSKLPPARSWLVVCAFRVAHTRSLTSSRSNKAADWQARANALCCIQGHRARAAALVRRRLSSSAVFGSHTIALAAAAVAPAAACQ